MICKKNTTFRASDTCIKLCGVAHFRCDSGYFGVYCVPYIPLPMVLKETFEKRLSRDSWPEVYGGEISTVCGILVSGTALTFFKVT